MRHWVWLAGALLLAGCGGPQRVRFYLTDAPLDNAAHVYVTLTGLKIFPSEGGTVATDAGTTDAGVPLETGPQTIVFSEPKTYDLLALRNGARELLGQADVSGRIEHMSLFMNGTATVVYADGTSEDATVPSGASSGLKIMGPFPVSGEVLLDFNAAESIHDTGNGKLIMRPVIHVIINGQTVGTSEPVS